MITLGMTRTTLDSKLSVELRNRGMGHVFGREEIRIVPGVFWDDQKTPTCQ